MQITEIAPIQNRQLVAMGRDSVCDYLDHRLISKEPVSVEGFGRGMARQESRRKLRDFAGRFGIVA